MTTISFRQAAFVTCVTMCIVAGRASASSGVVVVGGSANDSVRAQVKSALEKSVTEAGWTLPAKPIAKKESDALLGCKDPASPWTCLPASLEKAGVARVLVVTVAAQGSNPGAPITLNGQVVATDVKAMATGSQSCDPCSDDTLVLRATDLARQLVRDLALRGGRTMIEISSEPDGAQVSVDGQAVGVTNRTFNTYPGAHAIVVEKPGFERVVDEVRVDEGTTASRSYTLKATTSTIITPPPPKPPITESPSRVTPIVLFGAGAVFGTFGGYALFRGLADDEKYEYTRATWLGVGSTAIGVAAIVTGIYLWRRDTKRSSASAQIDRTGAVVTWTRTF